MHARIGRVSFSPEKADDLVKRLREETVPKLEQAEGFKGFTVLLDRSNGVGLGITFWENEQAMRATEGLSDEARQGAADAGSGQDEGANHYEVAIDTMA
jgi:heme-degrading monooxygenase HmoA